ncbi:MAG: amidohydrolase [Halobacteriaceae archaeon]
MTAAADLVLTGGEVHALTEPDRTAEAVAVRDGRIVRLGSAHEIGFLTGVETRVVDLGGRVLLPGFVDAHTHLPRVGRFEVHADLRDASGVDDVVRRLRAADDGAGWVLGYGFDESRWGGPMPDRHDLDAVAADRPVAAFREDVHTAVVNGAALDALSDLPRADVRTEGGEPSGVLVESAVGALSDAVAPDRAETRDLLLAARDAAHRRGVTAVQDVIQRDHPPAVYRDLAAAGDLDLRVQCLYHHERLDAMAAVGLRTGDGGPVETGAVKAFADGSVGGRTARLQEPYADAEGRGQWLLDPDALRALVVEADEMGYRVAVHAIGDAAVGAALDACAATPDPGGARHRIEHAELATDDQIRRMADLSVVASVQPNFLRWAAPGGLYEAALGDERRRRADRLGAMRDAGVRLAFGSDCMPFDPLFGLAQVVDAPEPAQCLDVTAALRAYTAGGAYAAGAEDRYGTIEVGKRADFVALDRSPWEPSTDLADIDVALTVVDGEIVFDGREG